MPIIKLTVNGKKATGDGTKIVCMNRDYTVNVILEDCEDFKNLRVKKLVVKSGRSYKESDIVPTPSGAGTVYTAILPPVDAPRNVEIGICGKDNDNDVIPKFTSTPAVFECVKSALCGAVVRKDTCRLKPLEATVNKTYKAVDEGYDGYSEVDVQVGTSVTEERGPVAISFAGGAETQVITPSVDDRTMSKVTLTKPAFLTPGNIKKGVSIADVVGTYEQKLTTLEVDHNGTYTPPSGFDGFNEVIVTTDAANVEKTIPKGGTFVYSFTGKKPSIDISEEGILTYGDTSSTAILFKAENTGSCVIKFTHYADNDDTAILREVYYSVEVLDSDYLVPSGDKSIKENGSEIPVAEYATVTVAVQPKLEEGSASALSYAETYYPSTGYDGFSSFTVEAAQSTNASGTYVIRSADIVNGKIIDITAYQYVKFELDTFVDW